MMRTLVGTSLLLVCVAAAGCKEKPAPKAHVVRPVRAVVVALTSGQRTRSFAGTSKAGVSSKLSFRVPSRIDKLLVKVGDRVEAKQLLAVLDDSDFRLEVAQAAASAANARAQARQAKAAYSRARQLYANQNASLSDLERARAAAESSRAQTRAAHEQVARVRKKVKYTKLLAPTAGEIAAVLVEVNENVGAGQPIVLLNAGGKPEVLVAVPAGLIGKVETGAPIKARFAELDGREIEGVVSEVGVAAMEQRSTFAVTATLNSAEGVRAGMSAEVTFTFGKADAKPRIVVPPVAVGEDAEGRHVYLVGEVKDGAGVLHRVPVTVGEISTEGLEVLTGLAGGEVLVTAGLRTASEGLAVRLLPDTLEALAKRAAPTAEAAE